MNRIYRYNPNASYKPNGAGGGGGRYLQLIGAKNLYIQNITVSEHNSHRDSFQVKFSNVFTKIQRLGPLKIHFMASAAEFCNLLCKFCLWCKCRAYEC